MAYRRELIVLIWSLIVCCVLFFSCKKSFPPSNDIDKNFRVLDKTSNYIVVIGDTQFYMDGDETKLKQVLNWISTAKVNGYKIDLILQTGDITNRNSLNEWLKFRKLFNPIETQIPVAYCVGNHDYKFDSVGVISEHHSDNFNKYVNYSIGRMIILECYKNHPDNAILQCQIRGCDFNILTLEFGPEDDVVEWAKDVVNKYNQKTIVLTHAFLFKDSTRYDYARKKTSQTWTPYGYLPLYKVNDGEELWNKLIKDSNNIIMVVCGHTYFSGRKTSINSNGKKVLQLLHNPQNKPNGGDGWIQILKMSNNLFGKKLIDKGILYNPVYNLIDSLSLGSFDTY